MNNTPILEYYTTVSDRYKRGTATEHTYRGDLQKLIESLVRDIVATNEPKRQECGAPDYIITSKDIPIGFIEAKDVGENLDKVEKSEQLKRYRDSLDNLILTDYLEFRLFRNGEKVTTVTIVEIENGRLKPLKENWSVFEGLIKDFCSYTGQTINNAEKLAKMMAAKARMMEVVIENALIKDQEDEMNPDTSLEQQFAAFKDILIHDIKPSEFADIYAQTIAYGMFAARLHDNTLDTFSRKEAADLIPKSNPFLRKLFQYIAGYDLDSRLVWIVDALADVFRATDIKAILKNFGKSTQMNDPIIHFYETFLSEYNPALRKSRGVWYTPEPVVNFIVRAVDDILKNEFKLKEGLASTETTEIEVKTQFSDKRTKDNVKKGIQKVHKVQILDPATGTGTFLSEVVKHIYKGFSGQEGIWTDYVSKHLLPRLNGFEILMASYAMCHLKLELLLSETGYKAEDNKRLRVYLTNSLEEAVKTQQTLFAEWLSNEAIEANSIKRDTPVMVVIGNPPYSGESANKGDWILKLMEDYKKEPSGGKLKEKNSKWINDDYVKFIRYGEHFIEKTGEGVLAFITNNGYLDNPTFRGMRHNLIQTFNKIYIIDLHGNAKKNELTPDGKADKNVFDIQQGVSIILAIKQKGNKQLAKVYNVDVYGEREFKYNFLWNNTLSTIKFNEIDLKKPYYFFVSKEFKSQGKYEKGFKINELFSINSAGIVTARDATTIDFNKDVIWKRVQDFKELEEEDLRSKYKLGKDVRDWQVNLAKADVIKHFDKKNLRKISYRPFDDRYTFYTGTNKGFYTNPRRDVMVHLLSEDNIALVTCRQQNASYFQHVFVTKLISESCLVSNKTGEIGYIFPLYLNDANKKQTSLELDNNKERIPNLNTEILKKISSSLGIPFTTEKTKGNKSFNPFDVFDYTYAVLHSSKFREKYKELLKIDFPRIPIPNDPIAFFKLVKIGNELREIHLLEGSHFEKIKTTYPVSGNNQVDKIKLEGDKVWINDAQYFGKVNEEAWNYWIGSYQPAQKWLKDRIGEKLEYADIQHYQKIITSLSETLSIMQEIDKVLTV